MSQADRFAFVIAAIEALIEHKAEKAKAEIRAMGEHARRSLGQKVRHAVRRNAAAVP